MKDCITLAGGIVLAAFFVFLYNCIDGLARFSGRINPAIEPWVFWGLCLAVLFAVARIAAAALLRPKPMMVYADPTEADMAAFRAELLKRLKRNDHLAEAGVVIREEADIERGLVVLNAAADEEIQATAKRVFLGTAVSQNGRLDTLVVVFQLSRLIWRIATLYNQRPHYRELLNLYLNIAATSFLAGSIEEFGLDEYITNLMAPVASGSAIGAVPGAQAIAGTITSSVLTGSTNSLLTLRCGIVARDYMSLNLGEKGVMRRNATAEAGKMFVTISSGTVTRVIKALVKGSACAVRDGACKTGKAVGETIVSTAGSVSSGTKHVAKTVGNTVADTAGAVAEGAKNTTKKVGACAKSTTEKVGATLSGGAEAVGSGTKTAVKTVGNTIADTAGTVAESTKSASHKVSECAKSTTEKVGATLSGGAGAVGSGTKTAVKTVGSTIADATETVTESTKNATRKVSERARSTTRKAGEAISGGVGAVGSAARKTTGTISRAAQEATQKTGRTFSRGANAVNENVRKTGQAVGQTLRNTARKVTNRRQEPEYPDVSAEGSPSDAPQENGGSNEVSKQSAGRVAKRVNKVRERCRGTVSRLAGRVPGFRKSKE